MIKLIGSAEIAIITGALNAIMALLATAGIITLETNNALAIAWGHAFLGWSCVVLSKLSERQMGRQGT